MMLVYYKCPFYCTKDLSQNASSFEEKQKNGCNVRAYIIRCNIPNSTNILTQHGVHKYVEYHVFMKFIF